MLVAKLAEYRKLSYGELAAKIGDDDYLEATGESSTNYQIEVQFMWNHKPGGDVRVSAGRVSAGIDDGGLRAFPVEVLVSRWTPTRV